MLRLKTFAAFVFLAIGASTASAQTLNTFTDGQPAVAAQVNQNFTMLLNEINTLKAQLAALQPASLSQAVVGTWDVVSLDTSEFKQASAGYNFFLRSFGSKGVLVLKSDGTFTITSEGKAYQMEVFNTRLPFVIPNGGGSFIRSDIYTGVQNQIPDNGSASGTYSISGNLITLNFGSETTQMRVSKDGNVITTFSADETLASIAIAVKR